MKLNDSQREAAAHVNGPMIVLAGPGSGKTMVITHRVRHLIRQAGVNPSEILVVTFTRAAADEMRQRFVSLMKGEQLPVSFGTFHAIFFTILKHSCGYTADNIVTEEKRRLIVRQIAGDMQLGGENLSEMCESILGEISKVKGGLYDIGHYYALSCGAEEFRRVFRAYNKALADERLIDFEDMMSRTFELFRKRRDILAAWQKKFRYILVDEFQDISTLQYQLIRMLALPENNLFIVGDDDQSIYGFRGARPEIMLRFGKDYPDAKQVVLGINYRSRKEIVQAAQCLIRHNKRRFAKEIRSGRESGEPVAVYVVKNTAEEICRITELIREKHDAGTAYSQMAVLMRTAAQARPFLEQLETAGIPFQMQDGVPNLYRHWISEDIFAYLRIAEGSTARSDFLRIINRPNRYVSRQKLTSSEVDLRMLAQSLDSQPWIRERVERLEADIALLRNMAPYAAVNYIRRGIGYDVFLTEYARRRQLDEEDLVSILDELQEDARAFRTIGQWFSHIREYCEQQERRASRGRDKEEDAVTLATMHHAKGLEYDIVFLPDACERITPHHKAQLESDIEEERRLFYVAVTRAKEKLYIFSPKERYGKKTDMSRFVKEIMTKRPENV